jgi:TRAP-type C4-dicarboxylate transport system permease small subunit
MNLIDYLYRFLRFLIFCFLVVLVGTVALGVFFRYVLHNALYWVTELSTFIFIWIVFVGAAVAFREKLHIRVAFLVEKFSLRIQWYIETFIAVLLLAFFVFLTFSGIRVVIYNWDSYSEAMKIPYGLVYICIPFTSLLMGLHTSKELIQLFHKRTEWEVGQ